MPAGFGKVVAVACSSFAITNIDDFFVLVTFFSEASTSHLLTPLRIVVGQYIGFTAIVTISLIGFGVSFVLPTEPIGFMGFLPLMLGVWRLLGVLIPVQEDESEDSKIAGIRSVLKVSLVTLMNGGDNIGTYVPLFSQAKKANIVEYIAIYYILLGLWCLAAFLVMRQKHILALSRRYVDRVIPFLYIGLGLYIVIKSSCYPWSIAEIDKSNPAHLGRIIMPVVTAFVISAIIIAMVWFKLRERARERGGNDEVPELVESSNPIPPIVMGQIPHEIPVEPRDGVSSSDFLSPMPPAAKGDGKTS